jgi:hypothetical protein
MMIEGMGGAVNDWAQGRHQQRMGVLGDAIFGRTQQQAPRTYDADKTDVILADLRDKLHIETANSAGLTAQVIQLKAALEVANSKHALFQKTDQRKTDGQFKTRLRLIWENTFDETLRKIGGRIAVNPKAHRAN